jgi:hypothetical protein
LAITLIAGIKQANNGTFALVDSNDIHGGLYHTDTLAEMQGIPLERIKDGMLCYVSETKMYYKCNATLNNKKVVSADWVEFTVGSDSGGITGDDISHIFVGENAPDNLDLFWYDPTDEDDEEVDESDYTLSDAKADIESLVAIIAGLEARIKYLEENGVVGPGGGGTPGITHGSAILLENGESILLENGEELLLESFVSDSEEV